MICKYIDGLVENSQDEKVNNNINTDVKIDKVGVEIAVYETKEKVFLFHVKAENTVDKDIFSIFDDAKPSKIYKQI